MMSTQSSQVHSIAELVPNNLPKTTLKTVMSLAMSMSVKAGETVIQQGEVGNDYYIIASGRCQVVKRLADSTDVQVLAELTHGDAFGEEAIIAQSPRSASVLMKEDGTLLRLNKDDFSQHLQNQFINYVDLAQAKALLDAGAQWLDVRSPREHARDGFGLNLPLNTLRFQISELEKDITYIAFCNDSKQSAAAGFILNQKGYKTLCLCGGLEKYQSAHLDQAEPVRSPRDLNGHADAIALYKDMLVELTVNNQKELRRIKAEHSKEIEQLHQKHRDENSAPFNQSDLLKRITSLEKSLDRHRLDMNKLIEEKNAAEVKSLAQHQLIQAFNDLKAENTHVEEDYKKTLEQLLDAKNERDSLKTQLNDLLQESNTLKNQLNKLADIEKKYTNTSALLALLQNEVNACANDYSLNPQLTLDAKVHDLIDHLRNKTLENREQTQLIASLSKEKEHTQQANAQLEHIIKNKASSIAKLRQEVSYLTERLETSEQMIKILELQTNQSYN